MRVRFDFPSIILPDACCLGVWSWASIQYTVYSISFTYKGGGGRGFRSFFFFSVFGANLAPCWLPTWLHVGSSWPKLASCWLKLAQVGLMLVQVGSSWPHVDSSWLQLASSCLNFASNWPQVGLRVNFGGKLELPKPENSFKNQWFFTIFQIASCVL